MFIKTQDKEKIEYYQKMLKVVGSISRLFSQSSEPYLYYRVAENLFCRCFNAQNHSRSDISVDASLNQVGFGLKTFLEGNNKKFEKIAEFNSDSSTFKKLKNKQKILEICRLRNERIDTTKRIYGLKDVLYHCIVRSKGKMSIFETEMDNINIAKVKTIQITDKVLKFKDDKNEYSFNISKSTLFMRFIVNKIELDVPIQIMADPFDVLEQLFDSKSERQEIKKIIFEKIDKKMEHVFLPLFSVKTGNKIVHPKSGLNQWNASGRKRKYNEVYIQIPSWVHKKFPGFFPAKDIQFKLNLPDKKSLVAKVCQENNKALMTNPNSDLGQCILRDVLNLKEGNLLTYKKLEDIGLDTVVVYKNSKKEYSIDFTEIGSYEKFEEQYNN